MQQNSTSLPYLPRSVAVEEYGKQVAADQPMGHAHQMPAEPRAVLESTTASTTRRIRSVKVAAIN